MQWLGPLDRLPAGGAPAVRPALGRPGFHVVHDNSQSPGGGSTLLLAFGGEVSLLVEAAPRLTPPKCRVLMACSGLVHGSTTLTAPFAVTALIYGRFAPSRSRADPPMAASAWLLLAALVPLASTSQLPFAGADGQPGRMGSLSAHRSPRGPAFVAVFASLAGMFVTGHPVHGVARRLMPLPARVVLLACLAAGLCGRCGNGGAILNRM